jgi:hypothetical protein
MCLHGTKPHLAVVGAPRRPVHYHDTKQPIIIMKFQTYEIPVAAASCAFKSYYGINCRVMSDESM